MPNMVNGLFPGELQPTEILAGCINVYEGVWPSPQQTILNLEKECANPDSGAYWQRAETIGDGAFQHARTNRLLSITQAAKLNDNPVLQNVHNQFNMLLLASTIPYTKRYGINEGLWHEGYSLLKYNEGEQYKSHYDGGTDIGRSISALVYLNDDFEGGEIEFVHFDIKLKPKAGTLILFPSNFAYMHTAHPVIKGTKYALVTWIKDRQV
jgi:predicted 2-oxoglutarate/Fe(II)-dependent dioxygenase YbiX